MDHVIQMPAGKRRWYLSKFPCTDDELMDVSKPPPFRLKNLCVPRLRKCAFDLASVDWERARPLGMGVDGCVYRVYFGDQGPFALKLFWRPGLRPTDDNYSAAHRECQAAALLQMLRASIDQAAAAAATVAAGGTPDGPVDPPYVMANPTDHFDHADNFCAFAEEVRQNPVKFGGRVEPPELVPVTTMPRFATCYGWLRFNVQALLPQIPRHYRPRPFEPERKVVRWFDEADRDDCYGIVYEYICSRDGGNPGKPLPPEWPHLRKERIMMMRQRAAMSRPPQRRTPPPTEVECEPTEAELEEKRAETAARRKKYDEQFQHIPEKDRERATAVLDFLYQVGFELVNVPLARNWKNGVLVDHSEIAGPFMSGWRKISRPVWSVYKIMGLRDKDPWEKTDDK